MAFKYHLLDPRPQGAGANEKIFSENKDILGVEVTVPALAEKCNLGNIDPQHSGGDSNKAAIEVALTLNLSLLPPSFSMVTIRPDLDSVGTMAVISIRRSLGCIIGFSLGTLARIGMIARSDAWSRGDWQAKPLPTWENPFPEEGGELAAMAAAVADFKIPLDQRVEWMKTWLLTGEEPEGYRTKVEAERLDMVRALEDRTIKFELSEQRVAVVESIHRAATSVGYSVSPVVVALNPEFRFAGGDPHRKFTICQHCAGWVNMEKVKEDLCKLEPGWGGSPSIIGSPQGISSNLDLAEVVRIVEKHLLKII